MIDIPKNPLTLMANGLVTDWIFKGFLKKYLSEYDYFITSAYRSPEDQARLKDMGLEPAEYSAHLYNLARDFVIMKNGRVLPDAEMKTIYERDIKPNWPGYSEFSAKKPATTTGWIHVNLSRDISKYSGYIGLAGTVFIGGMLVKKGLIDGKAT